MFTTRVFVAIAAFSAISCVSVPDPQNLAEDFYNLGNGYLGLKNYEKASEYYKRALEINPKLYQGQFNLVQAYVLTGRLDDAKGLVDLLISKDPENTLVREASAFLLAKQGRFDEAYTTYKSLYEQGVARQSVVSNLLSLGDVLDKNQEAFEFGLLLKSMAPDSPLVSGKLGIVALKLGKENEADLYLEEYESSIASDQKALAVYAERLASLEYFARAIRVYNTLATLSPKDASAWFRLSELYLLNAGDAVGGKAAFSKAMESGYSDKARISKLLKSVDEAQRSLLMQVVQASLSDFTLDVDTSQDSNGGVPLPGNTTTKTLPDNGVQPPPTL